MIKQLEQEIREAIIAESFSTDFYGLPGTGIVHPCTLRAMVKLIGPLKEEIEFLKSQIYEK